MARIIPHPLAADLHDRAYRAGILITEVLAEAGVAHNTWARMRAGGDFRASTYLRLEAAITTIIEREERAHGG